MFKQPILVLVFERGNFKAYTVSSRKKKLLSEQTWNEEDIVEKLIAVSKLIRTKEVCLLFSESVSYYITFPFSATKNESEDIKTQIIKQSAGFIPEDLEHTFFNYKLDESTVSLFAVVGEVYREVVSSLAEAKLKVLATTTEQHAQQDHEDYIMGAVKSKHHTNNAFSSLLQSRLLHQKNLVICFVVLLGLSIGLASTVFLRTDVRTEKNRGQTVEDTAAQSGSIVPTPSPVVDGEELAEAIDFAEYKVQVLNSTTEAGLASSVEELLEENGFEEVTIGNADQDQSITTIAIDERLIEIDQLYEIISDILSGYETEKINLSPDENYDIIIVIGR